MKWEPQASRTNSKTIRGAPIVIQLRCECGKIWQVAAEHHETGSPCPDCGRLVAAPISTSGAVLRASLRDHRQAVRGLAFSPDSRLCAAAAGAAVSAGKGQPGSTILWDIEACLPVATLHWHREAVLSVAFCPLSATMATGSRDGTIAVWDVSRGLWDAVLGVRERSWMANAGGVASLAFSAGGEWLASAGEDRAIRIWATSNWQAETAIPCDREGRCQAVFSPCGRYLSAIWESRGAAVLWDVGTWKEYLQLRLPANEDSEDYGLAFSPDGDRLAVLGSNEVRIWDVSTCQILTSFRAPKSQALAWSPLGKLIATGGSATSGHATLRLWDADTGAEFDQFAGQRSPITAIAFSRDGRILAAGSQDATVNLWALAAEHISAR
jgi:WD40 repeat protein